MSTNEVKDPYSELSPETKEAVQGLIHLGALGKTVEYCGHSFGLKMLHISEELAASEVVADFQDNPRQAQAWATAVISMALTHVDGDEEFCPQATPDMGAYARARFRYVSSNWFWPVVEYLYREYSQLAQKQSEVFSEIEDLSRRGLHTSTPSVDSSIDPDTLKDLIDSANLSQQ